MEFVSYWKLIVLFLSADGTAVATTDFFTEDACSKAADWVVSASLGETGHRGDILTTCIEDVPPDPYPEYEVE